MTPIALTAAARLVALTDCDLGDERDVLAALRHVLPREPGPDVLQRITDRARELRAGCFEIALS